MPTRDATNWIDARRAPDGSLGPDAIRALLPYGDAFLFVDRVTRVSRDEVEATYRIPPDAAYVRAHFRHAPLMPGVLVGEGMVQAGTVLVRYRLDLSMDVDMLVTDVERAQFFSPALPGDELIYRVTLVHAASYGAKLVARADVGTRQICGARLCLALIDRKRLRELTARDEVERP